MVYISHGMAIYTVAYSPFAGAAVLSGNRIYYSATAYKCKYAFKRRRVLHCGIDSNVFCELVWGVYIPDFYKRGIN